MGLGIKDLQPIKIVKSYTDFQTAAMTNTLTIYTAPAGMQIDSVVQKHTTSFLGGAIASVTSQVGVTGELDKFVFEPFDVMQVIGPTIQQSTRVDDIENWDSSTGVEATMDSTGANLDALTQGVIEYYIKISQIKR